LFICKTCCIFATGFKMYDAVNNGRVF
jgi:hypothetical protein